MATTLRQLHELGVSLPTDADVVGDPRLWKYPGRRARNFLLTERIGDAAARLQENVSSWDFDSRSMVNVESLSQTRREVYGQLQEREWFQRTDMTVKRQLLEELPASFDGFLRSLTTRPDDFGGVQVLGLERLALGNYGLIPVFRVEKGDGSPSFTYEYHSWGKGEYTGAKGLLIIEDKGKPTALGVLKGQKFAVGGDAYDAIGGFIEPDEEGRLSEESVMNVILRVARRELTEELGLPEDVKLDRVGYLGQVYPDAGLSNEHPGLFAAVIDAHDLEVERVPNLDLTELDSNLVVIPLEQLPELIRRDEDGYFLSALTRAVEQGYIPACYLSEESMEREADLIAQQERLREEIASLRGQQVSDQSARVIDIADTVSQVSSRVRSMLSHTVTRGFGFLRDHNITLPDQVMEGVIKGAKILKSEPKHLPDGGVMDYLWVKGVGIVDVMVAPGVTDEHLKALGKDFISNTLTQWQSAHEGQKPHSLQIIGINEHGNVDVSVR